ncbi:3'(2'),5'-bisphosphate nucleotidase CysQ [Candidatus Uabimicrobium amorphum]|uniref:3'(2'),5'-bisphosphate nucleotidase CysQ n=1 Tax=Uabimicrobium amorphum TaxID=2596890 RepID=A0A5S9F429_UABAM|nr:3'(2'),5'-bisphosphate nucleotidase CysQ [Candidatus Uabimicrobium amorphum]BBM84871.1 3'(2'),5'-bisphosphate nucleotidase CysQ [Candidatus Uabimicrobium amorphum]
MSSVDIELIKKIAIGAAQQILKVYNSEDFAVETKEDSSPLTKADRLSNDYIVKELQENYADIPIVSEENEAVDYEVRKKYTRFWLVDPLDGTKEFVKKNGEFTVNIALIEQGSPILGVIHIPVSGKTYWAQLNEGAYCEGEDGVQKLCCEEFKMSDENLSVVCSRSNLNEETKEYIAKLNNPQTLAKGSSLKFMLLAEGEAHLYPRLSPVMEWDIAAADIILREAGGRTVCVSNNQDIVYNNGQDMRIPSFIAYAKKMINP